MCAASESSRTSGRYARLPVRWRWPVLIAVLPVLGWAYVWPAIAFGTSYCPPGPPAPGDLRLLRVATLLAFASVAAPFLVAALIDLRRGARREGLSKVGVTAALLGCGAVVAAGASPSTWCF